MTNVAFKLQDAGFSREQVEALTEFTSGSVATKENIAHLDGKITSEIAKLDSKITSEIARLDGRITSEIAKLRSELKEDIAHLDGKIIALDGKVTLLCWMFGILIAGVASLVVKAFSG